MANILCITEEDSLEALGFLGADILKIKEKSQLDYGKIKNYSLVVVEEKFYNQLKEKFSSKVILPLSGLKGNNELLRKSLKGFVFKATSQRIEI